MVNTVKSYMREEQQLQEEEKQVSDQEKRVSGDGARC